jgi:hypothetical protein
VPDDAPPGSRSFCEGGPPLATLWQLALAEDRLFCSVYRHDAGLQLRVESSSAVILSEPFELQPRVLARTQALRESLKRRGWRDVVLLLLCLAWASAAAAQTVAEFSPDVTSVTAAGTNPLRMDVYAASYRGSDTGESVLVGAEIRGVTRNARRIEVTYAFEGEGMPSRATIVALDEARPRPDPATVVRVLERFPVPAGSHRVRLTVRDPQDGRTVSAVHAIEVPPYGAQLETIAVSHVMLTASSAGGFTHAAPAEEYQLLPILAQPPTARREFLRSEKLEVLAEVYDVAPQDVDFGGNMTVWTRVRDAAGTIVFDTSDIGASEIFTDGRWGYQHWQLVPIRDLAPGTYLVQVGAMSSDGSAEAWRSVPITIR